MTIANGSGHQMSYVAESTQGTTPSTPSFSPIRHVGTTLGLSKTTITSAEIRSDRQITDVRHGNYQVGGDVSIELSYGSFDDLLEAVFGGTWTTAASETETTFSAASSDNSFNDSGSGFVTAGFVAGQTITVSGFTESANNGTFVVESVVAGKMVVSGGTLTDEAAGDTVTIAGPSILKGGTTRRYFTFERLFTDLTQYLRYTGCEINTLSLDVQPNAMVTGGFGVVGLSADAASASAIAGATYGSATTSSPMDSFTGSIEDAGSAIAVVTQIQLDIDNGVEPLFVVGQQGATGNSIGRFAVTGTLTAYFDSVSLLNKFVNETESDLMFVTSDGTNNYRFRVPRIKYNGGQPDVADEGPVTLAMPFQALLDSSHGTSLSVERY